MRSYPCINVPFKPYYTQHVTVIAYNIFHQLIVFKILYGVGNDFDLSGVLPMGFDFGPSDQTMSLTVTVFDDNRLEVDENFALSLFHNTIIPDVSVVPERRITTVIIEDNEGELIFMQSV